MRLADKRHVIGIVVERLLGFEVINAVFKLYHGPFVHVRLAAKCGSISIEPVWLSIDYRKHHIDRALTMPTRLEHVQN